MCVVAAGGRFGLVLLEHTRGHNSDIVITTYKLTVATYNHSPEMMTLLLILAPLRDLLVEGSGAVKTQAEAPALSSSVVSVLAVH